MFDEVAEAYHSSTPQLPSEYVDLIHQTFDLDQIDPILDLGCGAGLLTVPLAKISTKVEGLDSSVELLRLAKQLDSCDRVNWISESVENFQFRSNHYKLIIAFESFHLFPQKFQLIRRISRALTSGGYFSVGWCDYHWESVFRDIIIQVFSEYGITWGEWGYQAFPELESLVTRTGEFGSFLKKSIDVNHQISTIDDIAEYLASIEKSSTLSRQQRRDLKQELKSRFYGLTGTELIRGTSHYSIAYTHRL